MSPSDNAIVVMVMGFGGLIIVLLNDAMKKTKVSSVTAIETVVGVNNRVDRKAVHQRLAVALIVIAVCGQAYVARHPEKAEALSKMDLGPLTPLSRWFFATRPANRDAIQQNPQPQLGSLAETLDPVLPQPKSDVSPLEVRSNDSVERVAEKPRNPAHKYLDDTE